jgi:hypothetical protein
LILDDNEVEGIQMNEEDVEVCPYCVMTETISFNVVVRTIGLNEVKRSGG